jgi:glucokinase
MRPLATAQPPQGSARIPSPLGAGSPVLAVDIGGTDLKAALFDESGMMRGLSRTPTPHEGKQTAAAIIDRIVELATSLRIEFPTVTPVAVGVIAPGLVDDEAGIGVHSTNLHWDDVPFKQLIGERLDLPCSFTHDARAAGFAEFTIGAAAQFTDVIVTVIGTGVSAAIILNGRPHLGGGFAGELGHAVIDPQGEACPCGSRGCLETLAAAGAIARRYKIATGVRPTGAKEVLERAQAGDLLARRVWDDAIDALAISFAQLTAVLAPQAIVIGGGLSQAGDALFVPLTERLDGLLSFHRRPALVPAQLGENAGLLGAALEARRLTASVAF